MVTQNIDQFACKQGGNSKEINNNQHGFVRNRLQTSLSAGVAGQVLWLEEKQTEFTF